MTPHERREPANRLDEITIQNACQWQINRIQDSHKALLAEARGASREPGGRAPGKAGRHPRPAPGSVPAVTDNPSRSRVSTLLDTVDESFEANCK
jgi:hypothetical protein